MHSHQKYVNHSILIIGIRGVMIIYYLLSHHNQKFTNIVDHSQLIVCTVKP